MQREIYNNQQAGSPQITVGDPQITKPGLWIQRQMYDLTPSLLPHWQQANPSWTPYDELIYTMRRPG